MRVLAVDGVVAACAVLGTVMYLVARSLQRSGRDLALVDPRYPDSMPRRRLLVHSAFSRSGGSPMSPMSSKPFIIVTAAVAAALGAISSPVGSPTASAAPPGFPDMNAFNPVDPKAYTISKPDSTFIGFVTTRGVSCTWGYSSDPNAHGPVECSGNILGLPDSAPDGGNSGCAAASSNAAITRHGGACAPFSSSLSTLNGGQKLTAVNVTCVVGADGLTACIDGDHGVVLQPSGSWTF